MDLRAVIFDLDGVITDTSDLHYRAWQRLADEEGLPFDRRANEALRGVARRASLELILGERAPDESEERILAMMERKNRYYVESLGALSPANLLPGARELLEELRAVGVKVALGSASKNAPTVLAALGIAPLFDAIADGATVERAKPAPDLFLAAAQLLGVPPGTCAVVEDAAAGVDAALAAGMWAVGLGPAERVGHAHACFASLEHVTVADLLLALEEGAWTVRDLGFDPAAQRHRETVFTVGNGSLAVRGSLEEGYPGDNPACFIHRLWDDVPLFYSELANVPRWVGVEVWCGGVPFRLDRGVVELHLRRLDMRRGVLRRTVRWRPAPGGPLLELRFERFASMAQPQLACVQAEIALLEAGDAPGPPGPVVVRVRAGLDRHTENVGLVHWDQVEQGQSESRVHLVVRTRGTRSDLAVVAEVAAACDAPVASAVSDAPGQPAAERSAALVPGQTLAVRKVVGFAHSLETDAPLDAAARVAAEAAAAGYDAARAASAAAWAALWAVSDVEIDGDVEAQIALRFNLFQLLAAAPQATERASIGAKTLSGFGYRHHVFWDTELFMLPFFTFTQPALARNMLMYRRHNLPGARAKARANGYTGAQFPWESAGEGTEVTPRWLPHDESPTGLVRIWTGDIEIHITADIAYAALVYARVTGDVEWLRDHGAEIILDGASFWASAARREQDGLYHLRDVIGPDEYHDHVDDNAYTNRLAQRHLEWAQEVGAWLRREHPDTWERLRGELGLTEAWLEAWRAVAAQMHPGETGPEGVIEQFGGFFGLTPPDFATLRDPQRTRSMQAILGIEGVAQTQHIKQPDVLMLQYLLPDDFSADEVLANYAYYDPRTDHEHGSSLAPGISAVMACRVGHIEDAYAHFLRGLRADLLDIRHNASDGIHAANAGGLWQAAVFGFGGLETHGAPYDSGEAPHWELRPRLPSHWSRLAFKFWWHGRLQSVEVRPEGVSVAEGDPPERA